MNKQSNIFVLGYFGYNNNQLDGQTVKTRDVHKLISKHIADNHVDYLDTQDFKYNKLSIFKMLWKACRCKTLIYLPAHNNLKYIFPVLFALSNIFRFNIQYLVIGGWLSDYLNSLPIHTRMLKRIKGIHSETNRLKSDLETIHGFKNVDILPNFRFFDFNPTKETRHGLKIVFMARIMKEKGLDWMFSLAEYIASQNLSSQITITFFGQINEADREYFFENVNLYDFVEYRGALQPDDIYNTLSKYDILILPTHFYTEGLPGSIVDAYISGIPVIATEWINAHEFIEDGKSGYIIPFENGEQELIDRVMYLKDNPTKLESMQYNALIKRKEFAPPSDITRIL